MDKKWWVVIIVIAILILLVVYFVPKLTGNVVNSLGEEITACDADIDGSGGIVGLGDFILFAVCYSSSNNAGWRNCTGCKSGYCSDADIDKNGAVGLGDFSIFVGLWGDDVENCEETPPEPEINETYGNYTNSSS